MKVADILKDWNLETKDKKSAVEWWDTMAEGFGERPIPTFEENKFLQLLERKKMIDKNAEVLDVGCGAGGHALAIAMRAKAVAGVDLSSRMIAAARRKAAELEIKNVRFDVADWHELDAKKEGLEKKFDLVYAHMTPAIQSYETFMKLSDCSRGWCAIVKPVKRLDAVHDAIRDLVGIGGKPQMGDSDILNAFMLLFAQERYPMIEYNRKCSEMKYPIEKAVTVYINRTKTTHPLTQKQEDSIRDYLNSIAIDGVISGNMDTTTATLYWHV